MMNKKKNNAFTAFLITLSFLAPTISIFWIQHTYGNASPLSKLEVTFTYKDDTPIGADLRVGLYEWLGEEEIAYALTDGSGRVTFADLTTIGYKYEYSWQNEVIGSGRIKLDGAEVKSVSQTLPYWTVEKTFYYGASDENKGDPVEGLPVYLKGSGFGEYSRTTGTDGKVTFAGDEFHIKAGVEYYLMWDWGGEQKDIFTIGRKDATPDKLDDGYLPLKSGGGKYLRLADSVRFALPTAVK